MRESEDKTDKEKKSKREVALKHKINICHLRMHRLRLSHMHTYEYTVLYPHIYIFIYTYIYMYVYMSIFPNTDSLLFFLTTLNLSKLYILGFKKLWQQQQQQQQGGGVATGKKHWLMLPRLVFRR